MPWQHPDTRSSFHLYPVKVNAGGDGRKKTFDKLRNASIGVNVHYIPVHLQPYYRRLGFAPGDFPEAENYYARAISLPVFASMTDEQQSQVIAAVKDLPK